MSNEITCTSPLTVPIIAYLDWLNNPTTEKKMFDSKISIKWYSIIESIPSTNNILGPHAKFKENNNWAVKSNERKIGAKVVVDRGIINISLVNNLNRSAKICQAPFLPIKVGPIRLWENAKTFRSVKTVKRVSNTTSNELSNIASDIVFKNIK